MRRGHQDEGVLDVFFVAFFFILVDFLGCGTTL